MNRQIFLVLAASSALALGGCGSNRAASTAQNASSRAAASAIVEALTGGAGGARADARTLRKVSDTRLAAQDYSGAMDARWKMLAVRSKNTSMLGALTSYAIQAMALDDLSSIASHLDGASCRKYAAQLRDLDAQSPTYFKLLEREKQEGIQQLQTLWSQPEQWQRVINEFKFTPTEKETLRKLSESQIKDNLEGVYKVSLQRAKQPFSSQRMKVATDPYNEMFSIPSKRQEFAVVKNRTERLLVVAALQHRADRLENRAPFSPLPADPFGQGPLKRKGEFIYSVGPDTRDDRGSTVPNPSRVQLKDLGDIPAPIF